MPNDLTAYIQYELKNTFIHCPANLLKRRKGRYFLHRVIPLTSRLFHNFRFYSVKSTYMKLKLLQDFRTTSKYLKL